MDLQEQRIKYLRDDFRRRTRNGAIIATTAFLVIGAWFGSRVWLDITHRDWVAMILPLIGTYLFLRLTYSTIEAYDDLRVQLETKIAEIKNPPQDPPT